MVLLVGGVHDIVALPVEVLVPDPDPDPDPDPVPDPDPLPDPEVEPEVDPLELDGGELPEAEELGLVALAAGVADDPEPPPQPDSSIPAAARPNMSLANLINTPPR